jgi:hypothetical protein
MPEGPLDDHPTILEALQAAVATQLAVLGDPGLTGTGESSAGVLGLRLEEITGTQWAAQSFRSDNIPDRYSVDLG